MCLPNGFEAFLIVTRVFWVLGGEIVIIRGMIITLENILAVSNFCS